MKPAVRFVGTLLANMNDKVKIRADGSMLTSTLRDELASASAATSVSIPWGVRRQRDGRIVPDADKGYFMTQWALVQSRDADARVVVPQLPRDLQRRLSA